MAFVHPTPQPPCGLCNSGGVHLPSGGSARRVNGPTGELSSPPKRSPGRSVRTKPSRLGVPILRRKNRRSACRRRNLPRWGGERRFPPSQPPSQISLKYRPRAGRHVEQGGRGGGGGWAGEVALNLSWTRSSAETQASSLLPTARRPGDLELLVVVWCAVPCRAVPGVFPTQPRVCGARETSPSVQGGKQACIRRHQGGKGQGDAPQRPGKLGGVR